nr:response regulator [Acetatifactor sp.]
MGENKSGREGRLPVERFVLFFYSLQMLVMILMSMNSGWSTWTSIIMVSAMVGAISTFISGYKNFLFRSMLITGLTQICFMLYGMKVDELPKMLPLFLSSVALMGLYGVKDVVWIAFASSSIVFFYRYVIKGEMRLSDPVGFTNQILHLLSVLFTEFVIWFWVVARNRAHVTLTKVIEELQLAQKSKDDFLANVSHEIRTPVNTICGMSEMALIEEHDDKIREELRDIHMAGRNLTSVISDVLDFSELQSGKIDLEDETYNISSTVNDIVSMAVAKKGDKPLELIINCDPMLPCGLRGDEKKIKRVIMNLVDNAIKFTEEGGVTIDISGRREDYGLNLVITVEDTGIGMADEHLEKLFTSFNQVDTHRNRKEGGIGLGLAISKALIQKMGGIITVKSKLGVGSSFKCVIPQKILDETPIVEIRDLDSLNIATCLGLEQFELRHVRDEYTRMVQRISDALHIRCHQCINLTELKRREEREKFTHIFVGGGEYRKNPEYFDRLSAEKKVVVLLGRENAHLIKNEKILRIYKPFYLLPIVAVLNGEKIDLEREFDANRDKFVAPDAKILVVDDNLMNIKVLEGLLSEYRMQVDGVTGGKDALQKMEQVRYDLIFMDHMMPE